MNIIGSIFRRTIIWVLMQIGIFLRFALPYVLRLILSAFGWSIRLSTLGLIGAFRGLPQTAEMLAEHWLEEALAHGVPSIWEPQLRTVFRVIAVLTILTGWIIMVFTVLFAISFVFGLLFAL